MQDITSNVLITDPFGLVAVLLGIPAILFYLAEKTPLQAFFKRVPVLIFAYFVPSILSNFGVIPTSHDVYRLIMAYVLPASLLLLTISIDIKGILKLGPKALIMFVTATAGIVIGGPIALMIWGSYLPPDIWKGMAALSGSWIGGGVNFVAISQVVGTSETMLGMMVIVDVVIGYTWTGVLMYFAGSYVKIDAKLKADNSMIEELKNKMIDFQDKTARVASTGDLMVLMAAAFGGAWIADVIGVWLPDIGTFINSFAWKIILITSAGIALSFTGFKNYEGAGASKLGTLFLYMLIGVIGAGADLSKLMEYPALVATAATWMLIHITLLFVVMRLIKAPLFFMAVGSQANVGGVASAPIVASAFHPSLATVGVLLGVLGYVMGTYAGLLCAYLLQLVSGNV